VRSRLPLTLPRKKVVIISVDGATKEQGGGPDAANGLGPAICFPARRGEKRKEGSAVLQTDFHTGTKRRSLKRSQANRIGGVTGHQKTKGKKRRDKTSFCLGGCASARGEKEKAALSDVCADNRKEKRGTDAARKLGRKCVPRQATGGGKRAGDEVQGRRRFSTFSA